MARLPPPALAWVWGMMDEVDMHLRVIQGGLGKDERAGSANAGREQIRPTAQDVQREAERRLEEMGWQRWQIRNGVTGCAVPRDLRYLAMQITFVAEAIARLAVIPQDYRSDAYWPAPARNIRTIS